MVMMGIGGRLLFEVFVHALVKQNQPNLPFRSQRTTENIAQASDFTIPCVDSVHMVVDPVETVVNDTGNYQIVYHSTNPMYGLIDSIFKVGTNLYAIQVMTGQTHNLASNKIVELEKDVGVAWILHLLIFVPQEIFEEFQTKPANQDSSKGRFRCEVWIIEICRPRSL
jgi:hypothetical protein